MKIVMTVDIVVEVPENLTPKQVEELSVKIDGIEVYHSGKESINRFEQSLLHYSTENVELVDTCDECGEEKKWRMIDLDGTNLEERFVCVNSDCSEVQ